MTEEAQTVPIMEDGTIDTEKWLQRVLASRPHRNPHLLKQAVVLARIAGEEQLTPTKESCLHQGLMMGDVLNSLYVDDETLAAAILYSSAQYTDLKTEDIEEHLGSNVSNLIQGTKQMASISDLYAAVSMHDQQKHNIDNIRKMLLAMVDDIRVVLLKITERLCILRSADNFSERKKQKIAQETMAIYAPLANRLGVIQIKLEMEDLAFKYLFQKEYQKISQFLQQNHSERKKYIQDLISEIGNILRKANVQNFQITGRAKHIYSIYRKMQRKNVDINEIYDVSALRILVPDIKDCYEVLSVVHSTWQHIPKEFDDYIAVPKPNGYKSIHTAINGPKNNNVEIQIRTYEMHKIAELGVAAHWVYKEDAPQKSDYEAKIAWLRQVMDWQQEITTSDDKQHLDIHKIFSDQVYIFTPANDIVDLPLGSTPLDCAYHIHSELGHRCRGAKVNGNIVPLTYQLKTGEHIEILTGKKPSPSRDWLNSSLGFLKTSRAKTKVLHWFKKQDYFQNISHGQNTLNTEFHRLNIKNINLEEIANKLEFKSSNDMLSAIGCGDIKTSYIINAIQANINAAAKNKIEEDFEIKNIALATPQPKQELDVQIQGIANLLTRISQCCKPMPGDDIVGYVTQGKGLSIHRNDCPNILQSSKIHPEKILNVSWGKKIENKYQVDLTILGYSRPGLIRDISNVIASENLTILELSLTSDKKTNVAYVNLTTEIPGLSFLSKLLSKINNVPNVIEVKRKA